jgi:hypothetical protein
MFGFTHPRIASVLLLAIFLGAGYLVATGAQRAKTPANGPAVEAPTFDPGRALSGAPASCVDLPRGWVLIHGGSDYFVDRGGVPILPTNFAAGVYATSSVNGSPITAVVPGPSTAEFLLASRENFY